MALESNVPATPDNGSQDAFYGWDWSATTHEASDDQTAHQILRSLGAAVILPTSGTQGWALGMSAFDAEGFKIATVYFGGARSDVHVVATSAVADAVRPVVAQGDCRTARVDTRVDTLLPFDKCLAVMEAASMTYGSLIRDWSSRRRGEHLGRTIYLGSPRSRIVVRLYEKWLESPGQYEDGTNRVEVQLRPDSRHKGDVSTWDRGQTFCASKTTRDLAERLGAVYAPKVSVQTSKGTPDLERTMEVMGQQYGPAFERFMNLSGGDLGRVLHYLSGGSPSEPDAAAMFADRLLSDRRAMDDLLRGAERVACDPEPPF